MRSAAVAHRALVSVLVLALLAGTAAASTGAASGDALAGTLETAAEPLVPYLYRNWVTGTEELQRLAREHPDRARLHSIGKSVNGLDLWVLEITNFDSDSPPLAKRPVLWFDGLTHGNEHLGGEISFELANWLLGEYDSDEAARRIVDTRHVYILPIVNPDGNLQDSRFNARAVNLNRNWPTGWGTLNEHPVFNNPGPYALSEPETAAIAQFIDGLAKKPDYFQSYHTGILLWVYPWAHTDELPPDHAMFDRVCQEAFPGDERCGPWHPKMYPASGVAVDWAYDAYGASAWTFEVSLEQFMVATNSPVRERFPEAWAGTMLALENVHLYGAHLRLDAIDVSPVAGEADSYWVRLTLTNEGYGAASHAEAGLHLAAGRGSGTARLGDLASGETRVASVKIRVTDAVAEGESLEIRLAYPKRVWRAPMMEDVLRLPLLPGHGLQLDMDGLAALGVEGTTSVAIVEAKLPAPGSFFAALAGLAAVLVLRRRGGS